VIAMRRALFLLPGLVFAGLLAAGAGRAVTANTAVKCEVPPELIYDDPKLTATAARFKTKQPLRIVAIGGASTAGTAAGNGEENSYPHRLQEALQLRHPGVAVTVINKGVARQTTAAMVTRFGTDVIATDPTLVIWETGTVDAVRGIDVDEFAGALQAGIAALRHHKFDIILVDMQYNSSTDSVINFGPYLEALHNAADLEDVYLFRRFDIMKFWSEAGVFDFVGIPRNGRARVAEEIYRCLGENLALAIDHGAE
jgi:hypothetical protein